MTTSQRHKYQSIEHWKQGLPLVIDDDRFYNGLIGLIHRLYLKNLITLEEANQTLDGL